MKLLGRMGRNRLVIAAAAVLVFATAGTTTPQQEPLKVLMLGAASHGGDTMTEVLKEVHERYPSLRVTVTENLEDLLLDNLKNYNVLCINRLRVQENNPPDFVKEGIVGFLKQGGGLVTTHFAVANAQNWRDSIHIFGGIWVTGKTTHKPYKEFEVQVKDANHPITKGIRVFKTTDELYYNMLMRPDVHVVLSANEELFGDSIAYPMLTTHTFYGGRVAWMVFGHDAKSAATPEFRQLLAQSLEWAGKRR